MDTYAKYVLLGGRTNNPSPRHVTNANLERMQLHPVVKNAFQDDIRTRRHEQIVSTALLVDSELRKAPTNCQIVKNAPEANTHLRTLQQNVSNARMDEKPPMTVIFA